MWDRDKMMLEFNATITGNVTCLNGTCTTPLSPPSDLKWGLLALIVVIFCTALGNLLVCLAVCWDRRLQNMTNYFLMSLAIADFLVSIIVMPFGMVVEIYGYFPLQVEFCAFWVIMDVLMCTASIWHMCTMSMDRYFTLKYPMQYGRNKTKTMVAIKIVFVWVISITISSPICVYGLVDFSSIYNDNICVITIEEFAIYGSVFAFYIPLCIMILTYLLTIRILWQNQNIMRTIDRSDFRMRPRHNHYSPGKACHVTTLLSPPGSDTRRDSQTEISSLGRTPNRERVNLPGVDDMKLLELKHVIDNAYMDSINSNIPNDIKDLSSKSNMDSENRTEHNTMYMENESTILNTECRLSNNLDNVDDCKEYLQIQPNGLAITQVLIQSPSEDEADENSNLLPSDPNERVRSSSNSPRLSRFRIRTNTDITFSNYPTTHSSLKIPKSCEKPNLQASVSCSNFSQSKEQDLLASLGLTDGGLINRDYKSLEWCQHFYQIQEEMDHCLRESRLEKKKEKLNASTAEITSTAMETVESPVINGESINGNTYTSAISVTKDELKPDSQMSMDISESGDSMDDLETSSDNTSDLLTIKLHPKSVYMYKLNLPYKSNSKQSLGCDDSLKQNRIPNGIGHKNGICVTNNSNDSKTQDKSPHMIRKRSSIRNFIQQCKRRKGLKQFISSKTTTNEKKASKVLGIIFAVFVVLWTPFFTANIVLALCHSCMTVITPEVMSAVLWMGYVASLANPIIYTMFNTAFRRAFIKILTCKMCKLDRRRLHRTSMPSYAASVYTDRRQTLTVLLNGNNHDNRIPSDFGSSHSYGR